MKAIAVLMLLSSFLKRTEVTTYTVSFLRHTVLSKLGGLMLDNLHVVHGFQWSSCLQ